MPSKYKKRHNTNLHVTSCLDRDPPCPICARVPSELKAESMLRIHPKCKTGGLHGKGCGLLFGGKHVGRETNPDSCQWCSRVKTHPEPTCYWCTNAIKENK